MKNPVILIIVLILSISVMAEIPNIINYQGRLLDSEENPVADGSYSVIFSLYNINVGGAEIWADTQIVNTTNGLFTVQLGSVNPLTNSIFSTPELWLGITVGTDPELSPRQKITSVGYAFRAAVADSVISGGATSDNDWLIQGDTISTNYGRVGIGTSSPKADLDIVNLNTNNDVLRLKGTTTSETRFIIEDAIGGRGQLSKAEYDYAGFSISNKDLGNKLNIISTEGDIRFRIHPEGSVLWDDDTYTKMFIDAGTGYVGIGNSQPTHKLQIGNGTASSIPSTHQIVSANDTDSKLSVVSNNKTVTMSIGDASYGEIWSYNYGMSSPLNLCLAVPGGNVGIGTKSPTQKLHVKGNIVLDNDGGDLTVYGASDDIEHDSYVRFINSTGLSSAMGVKVGGLLISDSYAYANPSKNDLIVKGNVGIGKTNPAYKLDVGGTVYATSNITDVNTITGVNGSNYAGVGAFNTGAGHGLYASAPGPGFAGYFSGNVCISGNTGIGTETPTEKLYVVGNFCATGSKNAVVPTSQGMTKVYSEESAEVWFTDYGKGQLVNGYANIDLDNIFIETVTIDEANPMMVFLQEEDECNGLIVKPLGTSFEVIEKGGGKSNASFSYRIVAKRKGYESDRLESVQYSKVGN